MTTIRLYAYAAALLLAVAGIWYYGHTRYNAGVAHELQIVTTQAIASAAEAQTRTVAADAGAKAATDAGQAQIAQAAQETHDTIRIVTRVVHDKPSPAVCVAEPDVMHALRAAAESANRAAGELSVTSSR